MDWLTNPQRLWSRALVIVLILGAAVAIRVEVLRPLGSATPYVTFFPALMLVALLGGAVAGIVATVGSAVFSFYFVQLGAMPPGGWLAAGAFLLGGSVMSVVGEVFRRSRTRLHVLNEQLDRRIAEAARKGDHVGGEFSLRMPDGERSFELSTAARPGPDGERERFIVPSRDITDRKQSEEALGESRDRLQRAERVAQFGNWELDLTDSRIHASAGATAIYGMQGEEWSLAEVQQLPLPECRALLQDALAGLIEHGRPYNVEFRIRRKSDGELRDIHSIAEYDRKRSRLFGVLQDVTERKRTEESLRESEERFRNAFENANIGMCLVDVRGRFLRVNRQFSDLLGYSLAELGGMSFDDVTHPDFRDVGREFIREAVAGKAERAEFEKMYVRKDGRPVWARVASSLVRDLRGEPVYFISHVIDITERRLAEEKLVLLHGELERRVEERTTQLEESNRELEAFSYSVSHDLRAPLRAIEGFSGMIVRDDAETLGAEGRRRVDVVRENARKMSTLIDDLLAFSRTSRQEIRRTRVVMKSLARVAFEEAVGDAGTQARIELRLGDLPDADGDPSMIQQVWVNLLSNAVKYSARRERPVIEVSGALEGELSVYHVRDNGVGFDMKYVDKLFGIFQRLHGAKEFEGTGIGLALVKRIVTRHGGRVWAQGNRDDGATFSFALPTEHLAIDLRPLREIEPVS